MWDSPTSGGGRLLVKRLDLTSVIAKCNTVMASGRTSEFNLVWSSV